MAIALVSAAFAEGFAASLKHCHVVPVRPGLHYLQEDYPDAIGHAVVGWIAGIEACAGLPRAAWLEPERRPGHIATTRTFR